MIREKDMVLSVGPMDVNMQVSGEEVNNTEKELTSALKAKKKLGCGRTARKLNGWMQVKNELIIK